MHFKLWFDPTYIGTNIYPQNDKYGSICWDFCYAVNHHCCLAILYFLVCLKVSQRAVYELGYSKLSIGGITTLETEIVALKAVKELIYFAPI